MKYEAKVKELEELNRRYATLKKKYDESVNSAPSGRHNSSGNGSSDDLMRLKKMDQDRENILKEVEMRNEQLREVEAKLRSTQIELESVESEKKLAERKSKDLYIRVTSLENENKSLNEKLEAERENRYKLERENQSKIDKLEYEMLRKGTSESSFEKLLSLC